MGGVGEVGDGFGMFGDGFGMFGDGFGMVLGGSRWGFWSWFEMFWWGWGRFGGLEVSCSWVFGVVPRGFGEVMLVRLAV